MTDKHPRDYEPEFSQWMQKLTADGLHAKADIALEFAVLTRHLIAAQKELAEWSKWGIIEIAVRNPNVSSWMEHWEGRALKAEQALALRGEPVARCSSDDVERTHHVCKFCSASISAAPISGERVREALLRTIVNCASRSTIPTDATAEEVAKIVECDVRRHIYDAVAALALSDIQGEINE